MPPADPGQPPQPPQPSQPPPAARSTEEVKAELSRRAWIGLALVCVVGLLIGAILSIQGHDREWMASRLEAAQSGRTGERLVEGVLVAQQADQRLTAPYSGAQVLAYRAWRDTDRGEREEPFRDADIQAWVPLAVQADGKTYPLDTGALKATQLGPARALPPARYELLTGSPTFEARAPAPPQPPPLSAREVITREVALQAGDRVSVLGVESGGTLGGEYLVLFKGDVAAWSAQAAAPGEGSRPAKLAGLGVMAASALGLAWLTARWIMRRRRARR